MAKKPARSTAKSTPKSKPAARRPKPAARGSKPAAKPAPKPAAKAVARTTATGSRSQLEAKPAQATHQSLTRAVTSQEIELAAYLRWQKFGGDPHTNWLAAERELLAGASREPLG